MPEKALKITLEDECRVSAMARAVTASKPRSRVMARAAATICSRVNRQAGGMGHLLSATCVAQRVLLL